MAGPSLPTRARRAAGCGLLPKLRRANGLPRAYASMQSLPEVSCPAGLTPTRRKCRRNCTILPLEYRCSVSAPKPKSRRQSRSYCRQPRLISRGHASGSMAARRTRAIPGSSSRTIEALPSRAFIVPGFPKPSKRDRELGSRKNNSKPESAEQTYNELSTSCALVEPCQRQRSLIKTDQDLFIEDDLLASCKLRKFGRRPRKFGDMVEDNEPRPAQAPGQDFALLAWANGGGRPRCIGRCAALDDSAVKTH